MHTRRGGGSPIHRLAEINDTSTARSLRERNRQQRPIDAQMAEAIDIEMDSTRSTRCAGRRRRHLAPTSGQGRRVVCMYPPRMTEGGCRRPGIMAARCTEHRTTARSCFAKPKASRCGTRVRPKHTPVDLPALRVRWSRVPMRFGTGVFGSLFFCRAQLDAFREDDMIGRRERHLAWRFARTLRSSAAPTESRERCQLGRSHTLTRELGRVPVPAGRRDSSSGTESWPRRRGWRRLRRRCDNRESGTARMVGGNHHGRAAE